MWNTYWQTFQHSPLDWVIWGFGILLVVGHLLALAARVWGKQFWAVQNASRTQTVLLLLTELLPMFGLLGTTLAIMDTFGIFRGTDAGAASLSEMIQAFSPALSTTISGLLWTIANLPLNAVLWIVCPDTRQE